MEKSKITKAALSRLPQYLAYLHELSGQEVPYVSATKIASVLSLGEVLVRKDLAKVSVEGRCKTGRSRKQLIQDIEEHLEFCAEQMTQKLQEK